MVSEVRSVADVRERTEGPDRKRHVAAMDEGPAASDRAPDDGDRT
jgi:hypothetical protein